MLIYTFLISVLIEFFIFFIFIFLSLNKKYQNNFLDKKLKFKNILIFLNLVIAFNIITQLTFIFIIPIFNLNYIHYLVVSEFFIVLVEGYILYLVINKKIRFRYVFLISLLANFLSWQLTPFIYYTFTNLIF